MTTPVTLTPPELKARLDAGGLTLLDVREADELAVARIEGCVHIPLGELPGRTGELEADAEIVVMCHHGVRSERGARILLQAGFTRVSHLGGGIHAWSEQVDASVPTY